MRRFGKRLFLVATAMLALQFLGGVAPVAGAHSDPVIINSLNDSGRYLELSDSSLDASIDAANAEGIAFAWLDQGGDSRVAESLADDFIEDLDELGSRYRTVVVLTSEGYAASSTAFDTAEVSAALDASFDSFGAGSIARGVDQFSQTLSGFLSGQSTGTTVLPNDSGSSSSPDSGGIGFGTIMLGILIVGGGFLLFRRMSNGRKAKRQAEIDMNEDRAEIKEQLKNNADRVISLGDRVIATGDQQLIRRYEEASTTYQDVSHSIDGADTAAEVDALDDRIDHAEWQFEAIEAELSGLPIPPSPAELEAQAAPPPPSAPSPSRRPSNANSGADEGSVVSPRTGRRYPTPGSRRGRRASGGGMGGMGGALGSILGSIVLNGGLGGGRSRRSQRRSGGMGGLEDIFGGGNRRRTGSSNSGGGGFGGLGGGVLKRGGSGSTRRTTRTGSSGRSRSTRTRGRGGRSF